jgi:hypothetical protein
MTETQIRELYQVPADDTDADRRNLTTTLVIALAALSEGRSVWIICQAFNAILVRRSLANLVKDDWSAVTGSKAPPPADRLDMGPVAAPYRDVVILHSDTLGGAAPVVVKS